MTLIKTKFIIIRLLNIYRKSWHNLILLLSQIIIVYHRKNYWKYTNLAFLGFGIGEGDDPLHGHLDPEYSQEMIRAIDSNELKGFDQLEVQKADEWFV